jgi:hypothetical protein
LPANRILTIAQEITDLQGLLDLFKEDLNLPPSTVELGDGNRAPVQVVSQKLHFPFLAIDFDQRSDSTQGLGVSGSGFFMLEYYQLIGQDPFILALFELFEAFEAQRVFGAGDPKDPVLPSCCRAAK